MTSPPAAQTPAAGVGAAGLWFLVLIPAVASTVFSIAAICLLVLLYRALNQAAGQAAAASKVIGAGSERLESICERSNLWLFHMMKEMLQTVLSLENRKGAARGRAEDFREDVRKAIKDIVARPGPTTLRDLHFILRDRFDEAEISDALSKLRDEGVITWEGIEGGAGFTTPITLADRK
ncbi:MAG: hypothetical protein WAW37_01005 [Syntrophobacteraceae bacterium]